MAQGTAPQKRTDGSGRPETTAAHSTGASAGNYVTPAELAERYEKADHAGPAKDDPTVDVGDGDIVAMVSRDKNGRPDQSDSFEILVPEGASDAEKASALNDVNAEAEKSREA